MAGLSRPHRIAGYIGSNAGVQGIDPGDYARRFDTDSNTLSVYGRVFEAEAAMSELVDLMNRIPSPDPNFTPASLTKLNSPEPS